VGTGPREWRIIAKPFPEEPGIWKGALNGKGSPPTVGLLGHEMADELLQREVRDVIRVFRTLRKGEGGLSGYRQE